MAMAIPFMASLAVPAGAGVAGATSAALAGTSVAGSLAASSAAGLAGAAAGIAAPTVAAGAAGAAGMSTAAKVMLGLSALSGGASAVASHQAGVAADQSARLAAKQEKDAARGREIERRRGLLTALASQGAAAGAGGIGFSGGVAAAAKRDIKDARNDLLTDAVNTRRNVRMLRLQGKSARQAGGFQAATSLLDSGVKGYSTFG
jgi:hypothetical protein